VDVFAGTYGDKRRAAVGRLSDLIVGRRLLMVRQLGGDRKRRAVGASGFGLAAGHAGGRRSVARRGARQAAYVGRRVAKPQASSFMPQWRWTPTARQCWVWVDAWIWIRRGSSHSRPRNRLAGHRLGQLCADLPRTTMRGLRKRTGRLSVD
jgi:hypothetical protein